MKWVVDASIALKWIIPEPDSPLAHSVRRSREYVAPDLLVAECVNAIWRRSRIEGYSPEEREDALLLVRHLNIELRSTRELAVRAGQLAAVLDHPAYDCFYLALAEREDGLLLTADAKLAAKVAEHPGATPVRLEALHSLAYLPETP